MRLFIGTLAIAAAVPVAAEPVPLGPLPDTVRPVSYRIDFDIDPAQPQFSAHTEIDIDIRTKTREIFVHGNGLTVRGATIRSGRRLYPVTYRQEDRSGVVRLILPAAVPAGRATLSFDHSGELSDVGEGFYRIKVGNDWYSWSSLSPIDARRVFPSFDDLRFKTPFAITVTTPSANKAFSNAPVAQTQRLADGRLRYRFAPTRPIPTHIFAVATGPFETVAAPAVPGNSVRSHDLPLRAITTRGLGGQTRMALEETPKMLALEEEYFGGSYPYEKLDLIASPNFGGGAMENPGLINFAEPYLLMGDRASPGQQAMLGIALAHELGHQWFGNLVTPRWWDDLWLNESFADWFGSKMGHKWRPDLGFDVDQMNNALAVMDADSHGLSRPVRQAIAENRQIAGAFNPLTFGKGGQILTMAEHYLGENSFREGVRLYMRRFPYGTATAADFLRALEEKAGRPGVASIMQSFLDQPGVPLITLFDRDGKPWLRQERYHGLGVSVVAGQLWTVPVCWRVAATRCQLLGTREAPLDQVDAGALIPNAAGAGYYRFSMDEPRWRALLATARELPAREAMAVGDSLWADFVAGRARFALVIEGARQLAGHSEPQVAFQLGNRLREMSGKLFSPEDQAGYRRLMIGLYGPGLVKTGFEPAKGAHAADPSERQLLRRSLVEFVALEGRDAGMRKTLADAAAAAVAGDENALDPNFRLVAFRVAVQDRGPAFLADLGRALASSRDAMLRDEAAQALAAADSPADAAAAKAEAEALELKGTEGLAFLRAMSANPNARPILRRHIAENFEAVTALYPVFRRSRIPQLLSGYCSVEAARDIEALIRPRLAELGGGEVELQQILEDTEQCAALRDLRAAEIAAVLRPAAAGAN